MPSRGVGAGGGRCATNHRAPGWDAGWLACLPLCLLHENTSSYGILPHLSLAQLRENAENNAPNSYSQTEPPRDPSMVPAGVRPWEGEPTRRSPRAPGADQAGGSTFLPKARSPQATLGPHVCWREDRGAGGGDRDPEDGGRAVAPRRPPPKQVDLQEPSLSPPCGGPLLCTNHDHDTLSSVEREQGDQTVRGTISGDPSLLI